MNKIMNMLGMVSKKKLEDSNEAISRLRNRLADKKSKILKLENENIKLKEENRMLKSKSDICEFKTNLLNSKVSQLQEQNEKLKRELEYTKRYYKNRTLFLGLNNNIAFRLSYLLENKDNEFRII